MEFSVQTSKREEIVDITEQVKKLVAGKKGSACLVFVPHATASIIINENYDPLVCEDILNFLRKEIPQGIWKHDKIDGNADSHLKSMLLGAGKIIPMENGELQLGTWQGIALAEFDGPKMRKIIIKVLK